MSRENAIPSEGLSAACPVVDGEFTPPPLRARIFTLICTSCFTGGVGNSIISTFFPKEAAAKQVSEGVLGWIFSIFELATMIGSPLTMSAMVVVGSKPILVASNALGGSANVLLGFCFYLQPGPLFISACLILRVVAGISYAFSSTPSYALLPVLYGPEFSTASGTLEGVTGVSMILGPILGSTLYSLGGGEDHLGFVVPFIALGGLELLSAAVNLKFLPPLPQTSQKRPSLRNFSWQALLPLVNCVMIGINLGLLGPTLQPHLSDPPLNYSIPMVGLVFAAACLSYALLCPVVGAIDDYVEGRWAVGLMALGALVSGIGYCLVAPVRLTINGTDMELSAAGAWGGICLVGGGCALGFIPVYKRLLLYARHEEESDRQLATSAAFNIALSFGSFFGPLLGGLLRQAYGVRVAYTISGISLVGLSLIFFAFGATPAFRSHGGARTVPLLVDGDTSLQQ